MFVPCKATPALRDGKARHSSNQKGGEAGSKEVCVAVPTTVPLSWHPAGPSVRTEQFGEGTGGLLLPLMEPGLGEEKEERGGRLGGEEPPVFSRGSW